MGRNNKHKRGARNKRGPVRSERRPSLTGRVQLHEHGAYVITESGDYKVMGRGKREIMDGDTVAVSIKNSPHGERRAVIEGVVERAAISVVGTYQTAGPLGVIEPLDSRLKADFFILPEDTSADRLGVHPGDAVVARILTYPTRLESGTVTIERRIGGDDAPDLGVQYVMARYGYTDSYPEAALDEAEGLSLDVSAALKDPLRRDLRDRCRAANLIMVRCWHYIKDFLDHCEEMAEQATPGGDDSVAVGILQQLVSALAGASAAAEGSSAPATGAPGKAAPPTSGSTAANRAKTAMLAAQAAEESEEETENTAGSAVGAEEQEGDDGTESPTPLGTSEDDEENGSNGSGGLGDELSAGSSDNQQPSNCQTVSDTEQGRLPQRQTDTLSVPEGGTTEHDDTYRGTGYANAASDIARILEAVAEDAVHTSLEKERKRELNELAQSISYGNIHNGVNMTVHRICEVEPELRDEYDEVADDLLHISRQLQKSVTQKLEDSRRGGKQTSLLMGRRLDAHAIARLDGRVFCKNALPNEAPALSVGLLLDESGSMCSCDRATYARATAIILYDFCRALDIPIMVYGHSTSSGRVDLYSYAEFDAIDRDDRYRLMDISSRGSNRDGAALRYVAEQLAKRTEDVKILMLVSDGQPADSGYYGTAAEEDLRGVKQEYQRKGILFVAAAIGADKDNIERIYGDSFLDITNLNKLPVKLAGIIKRYIR